MEIPITDVVETLSKLALIEPVSGEITLATIQAKLDAIDVIIAQAKEIQELQAVVVRLRDELQGADRELRMLGNELNKMEGA